MHLTGVGQHVTQCYTIVVGAQLDGESSLLRIGQLHAQLAIVITHLARLAHAQGELAVMRFGGAALQRHIAAELIGPAQIQPKRCIVEDHFVAIQHAIGWNAALA